MRNTVLKIVLVVCCLFLFAGCGSKDKNTGTKPAVTVVGTDEIIKESTVSHTSGEAESADLYKSDIPFDGWSIFVQPHSESDFEVSEMDNKYFKPASKDYLIASFDKKHVVLYSYDLGGDPVEVRGKVVYESVDKLLKENKGLTEDQWSEKGYLYHGNVLYYLMNEEDLMGIEMGINKYDLLKAASAGMWKDYLYYFSMPYENTSVMDYYESPETETDLEEDMIDGIYNLFVSLMNNKQTAYTNYVSLFTEEVDPDLVSQYYNITYRQPSEFENCEILISMQEENLVYAVAEFYTVPENYPNGSIDNFMIGGLLAYEEGSWKMAQDDYTWRLIEDKYYQNVCTPGAYEAYGTGEYFRRFWIPFNLNQPFMFEGVVTSRVLEVYSDRSGDMFVTLYFANDTDTPIEVKTLDHLVVNYEGGTLFDVSAQLYETVGAHDYVYEVLRIPADIIETQYYQTTSIATFECTIDECPPSFAR